MKKVAHLLFWLTVAGAVPGQTARAQQLLADRMAYYPRTIQLKHQPSGGNVALLTSFDTGDQTAALYRSIDNGRTWQAWSEMRDTTARWHCCSGFWEVPQQLGNVAAGTLFWAPSFGCSRDPHCEAAIRIQRSTDGGKTWQPHSTLATGTKGLWEPEFIIDKQGRLVAYYSTEEHKDKGYNQLLAHKVSTDGGLTWGPEVFDVAISGGKLRPGMAIVRRMPHNGKYVMVYEICGMGCDVFIRFSDDGITWGDPVQPGTRIESVGAGQARNHFAHAPSFTITPNGHLIVVGQMLMDDSGKVAVNNGRVLMVNTNGGVGNWTQIPAPVPVPEAYDNPCPNYSSQLLVLPDGKTLLEVALKPDNKVCKPYVATRTLE